MTERIVMETFTKEVRRRQYDQNNRYVDDGIVYGKNRLNSIPRSDRTYIQEIPSINHNAQLQHLTDLVYNLVKELRRDKTEKVVSQYHFNHKIPPTSEPPKNPPIEAAELQKAITDLAERFREAQEKKKESKVEKELQKKDKRNKKAKELMELVENQRSIREQLEEQQIMLSRIDIAHREANNLLREDLKEALSDHKNIVEGNVAQLAAKLHDLDSSYMVLREAVENLEKKVNAMFVDEDDDEKKDDSSSGRSSSSSGSVAIELPPAILTDGRRPSQAYHMHTLSPAEELADYTAKKVLEEATRMSISKP